MKSNRFFVHNDSHSIFRHEHGQWYLSIFCIFDIMFSSYILRTEISLNVIKLLWSECVILLVFYSGSWIRLLLLIFFSRFLKTLEWKTSLLRLSIKFRGKEEESRFGVESKNFQCRHFLPSYPVWLDTIVDPIIGLFF